VTGDGLTLAPTPAAKMQTNWLNLATNMGVDVGLGLSHGPGIAGRSDIVGPYFSGPQAGPLGVWNSLGIGVGFSLTGYQDIATLNGFASVVPIPEPTSLLLLGAGLIGVALVGRRRRS